MLVLLLILAGQKAQNGSIKALSSSFLMLNSLHRKGVAIESGDDSGGFS